MIEVAPVDKSFFLFSLAPVQKQLVKHHPLSQINYQWRTVLKADLQSKEVQDLLLRVVLKIAPRRTNIASKFQVDS